MTEIEILELIKRLRDVAMQISDGTGSDLARELRCFSDELEADLQSGALPFKRL
jgi:hypothetical protein